MLKELHSIALIILHDGRTRNCIMIENETNAQKYINDLRDQGYGFTLNIDSATGKWFTTIAIDSLLQVDKLFYV